MVDDGINTSNNNNNNNNPEGEDREINLYAVFFKYMVYWPWFVASVLACCIGMYVFLRYQTPVYNVTSSVLIKEDEKKGANAASGLAAIQDLGMLSMTSNFDNEVEILRSRTLIKKVVNDMGLYIDMEESNALGFNPPLYKNSPVNVFITPEEADRLVAPVELRMRYTVDGRLGVRAEYKIDKEGDWDSTGSPPYCPPPWGFSVSRAWIPYPSWRAGRSSWWPTSIRPRPLPRLTARS